MLKQNVGLMKKLHFDENANFCICIFIEMELLDYTSSFNSQIPLNPSIKSIIIESLSSNSPVS